MTDVNYYIRIVNPDDDWQQVEGVEIVLDNYPDIDLFMSREIDECGEFFRISEGRTGCLIATGDTGEEAKKELVNRIREYCKRGRSYDFIITHTWLLVDRSNYKLRNNKIKLFFWRPR